MTATTSGGLLLIWTSRHVRALKTSCAILPFASIEENQLPEGSRFAFNW